MRTRLARFATNSLRCSAMAAVGRRINDGNGDSISSRPSSSGSRHSLGMRIFLMPRAGQITMGWSPRSRILRHSFSIGVWNPPITGTPASRIARARSYSLRMTSPGHRCEQNNAVRSASRRAGLPMVARVSNWSLISVVSGPAPTGNESREPSRNCREDLVGRYFLGGGAGGGGGFRAPWGFGVTPLVP